MRCVEAWSMVIPWVGFPLAKLLERGRADRPTRKYVALHDAAATRSRCPASARGVLDWPYVEGLRMDEAMHPLTLLATGLYGKALPNQNGAPLRLVVPWKYGFKGIKSIVKITLRRRSSRRRPGTSTAPSEYGFYANVNPDGRPSALEPGHRAAHRRVPAAQDAAVQRLRRAGRAASTRAWTRRRSTEMPPRRPPIPGSSRVCSPGRWSRSRCCSGVPPTARWERMRSPSA